MGWSSVIVVANVSYPPPPKKPPVWIKQQRRWQKDVVDHILLNDKRYTLISNNKTFVDLTWYANEVTKTTGRYYAITCNSSSHKSRCGSCALPRHVADYEPMSWRLVYGHYLKFGTWPHHRIAPLLRTAQHNRSRRDDLHQPCIFHGYHHHQVWQNLQRVSGEIRTFLQQHIKIGLRCPWLVCAFTQEYIWVAEFFKFFCPVNILSPITWQRFIKQAITFNFHTNQLQSTTQWLLIFLYCTAPPKCALQMTSPIGTRSAVDLIVLQIFVYTNEYQESRLLTKNVCIFTRFIVTVKIKYCKRNIAIMLVFFLPIRWINTLF